MSSSADGTTSRQHMEDKDVSTENYVVLKKKITLLRGISFITGTVIGGGIFISSKGILENTGSVGLALTIWVVCGIVSFFGAMSYAELGTCIKKSGGHYTYILEAYGPLLAFLRIWVEIIIIRPGVTALVSLAIGRYVLEPLFVPCQVPEIAVKLISAISLLLVMYINSTSVTWTVRLQNTMTVIKLLAMLGIIAPGLYYIASGHVDKLQGPFLPTKMEPMRLPLAIFYGLFPYAGWNIPRAISISMGIVIVLYVTINVAYCAVLTPDEILSSDAVAVLYGERLFGKIFIIVPIIVALSCVGSLNGGTFAIARTFFVASREGHLPEIISMIHIEKLTPLPAVIVLAPLALIMIFIGDIGKLINFFSFARWLLNGLAVSAVIYLRYKKPALHRPFKVPLYMPVIFSLTCFITVLLSLYSEPWSGGIGCMITLTGVPVYYLFIVRKGNMHRVLLAMGRITKTLQKLLKVIPQEITTY
uniref:cystine/glutamate transporter-like isoform X2 n=1 Tax=Myxine glutinosa TaxID=7769 RepID=UPI00358E43BE